MPKTTPCAMCGRRFSEEECQAVCSRCALFGAGGCRKVRCPHCGYEMPAPARLPGLIAKVVKKIMRKD